MEVLVKLVMIVLGLEMGEEVAVVFVREVNDWGEAVVGTATGEGLAVEVSVGEIVGLEKRDVDDGVTSVTALIQLLAFPHSASTSAMMSPPPVIESKVRREEMSASKELRLLSPGTSGGSDLGKGGACSLLLLTVSVVTWGVMFSDGDVAALSWLVRLLRGS